jgi:hypothetical protein
MLRNVRASGEKGATVRVLRSMKKWTPLFTELAESSLNQYNTALISYFL